jgi:hypothetical protein
MNVPNTSEEVHNFPNDMLDVTPESPSNPPVSTGCLDSDNSTTLFRNQFTNELETSNMNTLVSTTTVDCPHPGHKLGTVFNISSNKHFDMIQAFPNNLASMTCIIQTCRQTGVPLYIVNLTLKVISEEVLSGKLNLNDYPSYDTTMKQPFKLFSVSQPSTVSIPLGCTVAEQDCDIFHRSVTRFIIFNPHF